MSETDLIRQKSNSVVFLKSIATIQTVTKFGITHTHTHKNPILQQGFFFSGPMVNCCKIPLTSPQRQVVVLSSVCFNRIWTGHPYKEHVSSSHSAASLVGKHVCQWHCPQLSWIRAQIDVSRAQIYGLLAVCTQEFSKTLQQRFTWGIKTTVGLKQSDLRHSSVDLYVNRMMQMLSSQLVLLYDKTTVLV